EQFVDLCERGRLIHRWLVEQLGEPLSLVLHLPLQVQHLRLELLNHSGDRGTLFRLEPDGTLLLHPELGREQEPRERVLRARSATAAAARAMPPATSQNRRRNCVARSRRVARPAIVSWNRGVPPPTPTSPRKARNCC